MFINSLCKIFLQQVTMYGFIKFYQTLELSPMTFNICFKNYVLRINVKISCHSLFRTSQFE